MNYQPNKCLLLLVLLISLGVSAIAQSCFNSDFETGTVTSYDTYIGEIQDDGTIVINTQTLDPDRHKLVSILDDWDDIAFQYCTDNKYLPVVPPGGGIYAMRLGNRNNGAEAERIQLQFTVTADNSFFLLRYAVLLNDPSHDYYEQPRFRLSIKDQNGDQYPCGFYEVVAGPMLDNFEDCQSNWKVRPWTTIGIELLSYIGQDIIIEMMTTDCSRGGHAGYAYLDATCKALEIELFNNCTDTSNATMSVTPGFDEYVWSTGDLTSTISIPNPNVGDVYYVTVTSATGCQLVLNDTIPPFEVPQPPIFDPPMPTVYCQDTSFWFSPQGTNLQQIYSIERQTFIDSIFINTFVSNEYNFIAYSDSGCPFDTVTYYFGGSLRFDDLVEDLDCPGYGDGSVELIPLGNNDNFLYNWSNGTFDNPLVNVPQGTYAVTVTDQAGCTHNDVFTITEPTPLISSFTVDEFLCSNSFGSATMELAGGTSPYAYSFNNGANFQFNPYYDQFVEGQNTVIAKDANDCLDTIIVTFYPPSFPEIGNLIVDIDSCGTNNSSIRITSVINAQAPLFYSLNNGPFGTSDLFGNLPAGTYTLTVQDSFGCTGIASAIIPVIDEILLSPESAVVNARCGAANGSVSLAINSSDGVSYSLDNGPYQSSNQFDNLLAGTYLASIQYGDNCMDTITINIDGTPLPQIENIEFEYIPCSQDEFQINFNAINGAPPYRYQVDSDPMQGTNDFRNISSGQHTLRVLDINDCEAIETFQVDRIDTFKYEVEYVLQPTCGEANGEIIIKTTGGMGTSLIQFENEFYSNQHSFDALVDGTYLFTVLDESGCTYDISVTLEAYCTVYIPNIFSPNQDGVNDFFTINMPRNATGVINSLYIFDRWGEQVYASKNEPMSGYTKETWNGRFKGKLSTEGVYVYDVELTMYNGQVIEETGTVTVAK